MTLVPDSWSQKYCSEYFGVSEYLIRSARELKQRKGILAKHSQKKGRAIAWDTIDIAHAFYEDVSIQKGLCKHTERCSQTKAVSSVQSPWTVCCIQRKKPRCENWIFQVLHSPP